MDLSRIWRKKRPEAAWVIFNLGSIYEFAECTRCGHCIDYYDEYDMPRRCPGCGADMTDLKFEDDE